MRLGIGFMNGIGNFIFFTAALKILKQWGYDDITLHTHTQFLNNSALMELSEGLFTKITPTRPDINDYDHFLFCGWSVPMYLNDFATGWMKRNLRNNDFRRNGMHEVQLYLNMIGADWNDFDGYILEPSYPKDLFKDGPSRSYGDGILNIALANPDSSRSLQASSKTWDKMPELSKLLVEMGHEVHLIGIEGELEGCEGTDWTGKLSIQETAGVIETCDFLIAPSTCAAIIADVVGTPVVMLEGPILGSKTHPLQVPYKVIRNYISCAPCFQQKVMRFCTDHYCMKSIQVSQVYRGLMDLKKSIGKTVHKVVEYNPIQINEDPEFEMVESNVAYLFPCFNRYEILKECLESFRKSNPQRGSMLFLNDASINPGVQKLLDEFEVPGLTKYIFQTDWKDKFDKLIKYEKTPSTHAYNRLIEEVLDLENYGIEFDYISIIDPDAIFKQNWVQYLISIHQSINEKVGLISGFNYTTHPIYDKDVDETIYSVNNKQYRFRRGANLHYMMTTKFLKEVHGMYPIHNEVASADLSKAEELDRLGYKTLVAVPSLLQQIGAFGSSFSRLKSDEIAYDF